METKQNENSQELENMQDAQQELDSVQDAQQEAAVEEAPAEAAEEAAGSEKAPEQPEAPKPENGPEKPEKKRSGGGLRSNRFKRGGMATLMSVIFLAIVIVINILVGALADRFPSMNIDLTAQKLNSLSDQALEIAKGVEQDTAIYLIGEEESYRKDVLYSNPYGIQYSQVANLAEKLQEANPKISMEFIDPDTNPGFISEYPNESLSSGAVLVKTEKRYKVLSVTDLFDVTTDQTTGQYLPVSKVDSALAGALEIVNMDKVPVLTITTGHGEMLTSDTLASFKSLMEGQNFEVREINLVTEEIPEETQVLMLPTPTTDYAEEEIQKLREYLDDEERPEDCSLLVTCHATQGELPHLASFLEEWGVRVEEGMVAETDSSRVALRNASYVLVDPNEEFLTENSYSNLLVASSRPLTLLFDGNGDISTDAVWTTADSAYVATGDMTEEEAQDPETGKQTVAAISGKYAEVDGEYRLRSVVVFGSSWVFTDTFMNASAFGDRNYISDLMKYCTGTDGSSVSVYTERVQTSTIDVTASAGTLNLLGLGVFTIGLPIVILAAGLIIFLKRRHL